ncbi:MAG: Plug domain-containing protein [Desulfobacterales bacterium]
MAHIPGVEKSLDSPWGADIAIRGLNRNRVAVLLNGFRVNTATDINGRLGLVNPSDIQRN